MSIRIGDALPDLVVADVSAEKMKTLSALTRDSNPLHFDVAAAERAGLGSRTVNQGGTNLAYVLNAVLAWAGPSAWISAVRVTYTSNVLAGDTVTAGGRLTERRVGTRGEQVAVCEVWLDVAGEGSGHARHRHRLCGGSSRTAHARTWRQMNAPKKGHIMARIHIDHVAMCVYDLEKAVADWQDILDVLSPEHAAGVTRGRGEGDGVAMEWATFQHPNPEGVSIQLWAPATPDSWVHKVLARRGEFVHHICFASDDFASTMAECRKAGLPIVLDEDSGPADQPWMRWNFIPEAKAHGTLIELGRRYLVAGDEWVPHPGNAENLA